MEKILFLTHTETDGSLSRAALETLGAAVDLSSRLPGSTLTVGLVGDDVQAAADRIAACGAAIIGVAGPDFATSRYSSDAAAMTALAATAEATLVLAPTTSRLARTLPGVAQRRQGRIDTHVNGLVVEGEELRIQRWYYRQRMVATLSRTHRPWFLLIDSGVHAAWDGEAGSATVSLLSADLPEGSARTRVLGLEDATTDARTIRPDAELLFVAGAGWTKKQADGEPHVKEAEALILDTLEKTQASLGGSKSMVEQTGEGGNALGFMSHLNQIGQTGATPRHAKGLATCCHGEEPHVVGWRFINQRRAVNLDPNCGWAHGKTDVLYVADAFQVMTRVNALLTGD